MKTVITAGKPNSQYWKELWRFRELFIVLAWRDLAVRYRQTVVGISWAVIRPVLIVLIMTIIFHRVAGLPADGDTPYALMALAGTLPWMFFASSLSESTSSLISNTALVSKVYFPRMIVPVAAIVVAFVDLLIGFFVLAAVMIYYGHMPDLNMFALPIFLILGFIVALGPALFLSGVNVRYRDFRFVVPFIVQFGLYLSPVGFSYSQIPEDWQFLYALNPMVGVINGFRWSILGEGTDLYPETVLMSLIIGLIFLVLGFKQFRKMERTFADVI